MKVRLAIGVACLLGAGAVMATEPGTQSSTSASATKSQDKAAAFNAMDTNHDGYINKSEAQQAGMADYGVADKNADGRLDVKEFASADTSSAAGASRSSSSSTSKQEPY